MESTTQRLAKYSELASFGFLFLLSLGLFTFFLPQLGIDISRAFFVYGFTLLSLLTLLLARVGNKTLNLFPFSKKFAVFAFLPLAFLVASFTSSVPSTSLIGLGFEEFSAFSITMIALLGYLFAYHAQNVHRKAILAYSLAVSATLALVFQIVRIASGGKWLTLGYFTEPISNLVGRWPDLAVLGTLVLVVAMVYSLRKATDFTGVLVVLATGVGLFFNLVISIIPMWIIVFLVAMYCVRFSRKNMSFDGMAPTSTFGKYLVLKQKYIPMSIAVIAAVFIVFQLVTNQNPLFYQSQTHTTYLSTTRFNVPFLDTPATFLSDSYAVAKQTLTKKPFTGAGPSMFSKEWLMNKPRAVNETPWWSVDYAVGASVPLTVAVMSGALGLLALFAFLYVSGRAAYRAMKDAAANVSYDKLALSLATVTLLLTSLVYTPNLPVFALLFIFAALVVAKPQQVMDQEGMATNRGMIKGIILTVVALVLTFGFVTRFVSYANVFANRDSAAKAIAALTQATKITPSDSYYRALADSYSLEASQSTDIELQKNDVALAEVALNNAVKFDGTNYLNYVALGNFYAQFLTQNKNVYQAANGAYVKALELNPSNPTLQLLRARLEILNGNIKGAEPYIQNALNLKNNYTDAAVLASQIKVEEKDYTNAVAAAGYAVQSDVNNKTALYQYGMLLYQTKNYANAVPVLERLVQLSGNTPNAQVVYALGLSYKATNATDKAIAVFQVLDQAIPNSQIIKDELKDLRSGGTTAKPTTETATSTKATTKKP